MGFRHRMTPPRLLALSFLLLILVGTLALKALPGLYVGEGLSWLNALFTATSAVCVTGLIVVDTATHFTLLGQGLILTLIQLGGLGILTFATLALLAVGKRISLHQEAISEEMTEVLPELDFRHMVKKIILFALLLEGIGALLLFLLWVPRFGPGEALWHAVFQSISAFCNAGFSTFSASLMGFRDSAPTLIVIMGLILLGGLGFLTLEEARRFWSDRRKQQRKPLSLHSRLVLTVTGGLVMGGCLLFLPLEWKNALEGLSASDRILNALFMSVTPRTAGFNTVDYSTTHDASNFFTILLMSIGGSPGSTAGGLKTTTFALVGLLALARFRGDSEASAWGRSIPERTVHRSVGLLVMMFGTMSLGIFLMTLLTPDHVSFLSGRGGFLGEMFEVVSAFNTVGLSMGFTGALTSGSKVVIIVLMFVGRVGPLVLATALAGGREPGTNGFRYSHEDVMIG